jgi:hypothetical protein
LIGDKDILKVTLSGGALVNPASLDQQLIPALENGDRLSRAEFERRYNLMPDLKKAELIEGVVYVPSPLGYNRHGKPHSKIIAWLEVYAALTPGVEVADNATVRLDLDNEPQPDALLRLDEESGGDRGLVRMTMLKERQN